MLERLTFSRFVAALIVVVFHFGALLLPALDANPFWKAAVSGPKAVSYFFVLSGFIMAFVYGELGPGGARAYWVARLARIYPVYLLAVLASVVLLPATVLGAGLSVAMVQAFVPGHALALNAPGWSLSVEIAFYAAVPFLMPLLRRLGAVRFGLAALGLWLCGQIATLLLFLSVYEPPPSVVHDLLFYFPLQHMPTFLLGMAAEALVRTGRLRMGARGAALCVTASLAAYLAVVLGLAAVPGGRAFGPVLAAGFFAPLFCVLIAGLFFLPGRWSVSRPALFAGEASYALYLLQMPVMIPLTAALRTRGVDAVAAGWLGVLCLLVLAALVFRIIETPMRRRLRRLGDASRVAPAHVA